MTKITKNTNLRELITKYPETIDFFYKKGLQCAMCHMSSQETSGQAAEVHGIEVEKLVKELNKIVAKKK